MKKLILLFAIALSFGSSAQSLEGRNISEFSVTKKLYTASNVNLDIYMVYKTSTIDECSQTIRGAMAVVTVDQTGTILEIIPTYFESLNKDDSYNKFLQIILSATIPNSGGMTIKDVLKQALTDHEQDAINAATVKYKQP